MGLGVRVGSGRVDHRLERGDPRRAQLPLLGRRAESGRDTPAYQWTFRPGRGRGVHSGEPRNLSGVVRDLRPRSLV